MQFQDSKAYSSYLGWNLYSNINKLCIIKARVCQLSFPAFPMQVIKYHINIRKVYFYIRRNHNWLLNINRLFCNCKCLKYRHLFLVEVPAICKNLILRICLKQKKQYEFQILHNSCAPLYFYTPGTMTKKLDQLAKNITTIPFCGFILCKFWCFVKHDILFTTIFLNKIIPQ